MGPCINIFKKRMPGSVRQEIVRTPTEPADEPLATRATPKWRAYPDNVARGSKKNGIGSARTALPGSATPYGFLNLIF
jgi:hypothetical protein